jgi:diadenosine tetraphosphate (Ap4A) HIT family hydrolase
MACVFCAIGAGERPASLVFEDDRLLAFMDLRPASRGHVLVVPRRHRARIADLADGEAEAMFALGVRLAEAVRRVTGAPGAHLLLNDGRAANQTVDHVHLHVVPRWGGDFVRVLVRLLMRGAGARRGELDELAARIRVELGDRGAVGPQRSTPSRSPP